MADVIVLDTNVLKDIARGNRPGAEALVRYIKAGDTVYIARAAYNELIRDAPTDQMRQQYRDLVSHLRIQIAPDGKMADRVDFHVKNMQHVPTAKGEPGQLKEYGNNTKHPDRPGDAFVAAQAKAIGAKLWTMDHRTKNRAANLGVLIVPESSLMPARGAEDVDRARQLLGLNPNPIDGKGNRITVRPSAASAKTPVVNRSTGRGGGGSGGTPLVGVADKAIPQEASPISPRGAAKIEGMQLMFQGVNFVLNMYNDHLQKKKVDAALKAIGREVADAQKNNPTAGIMLLFYYTQVEAPSESLIKPGSVFHYVIWGQGVTRDEAIQDALKQPSLTVGAGPNERKFAQQQWLPALQKSDLNLARLPFPAVARGRFHLGKVAEAKFQLVDFNVIGGFDDIHEKSIKLPNARNAEFVILRPPSEVYWYTRNGRETLRIPLKTLATANKNDITVVDLDPYSPFHAAAAMCFPVDEWAETVFNVVRATDNHRILSYTNFAMIRWIRAENIHLLNWIATK
jgi:predicted nucleic acid-binding protein